MQTDTGGRQTTRELQKRAGQGLADVASHRRGQPQIRLEVSPLLDWNSIEGRSYSRSSLSGRTGDSTTFIGDIITISTLCDTYGAPLAAILIRLVLNAEQRSMGTRIARADLEVVLGSPFRHRVGSPLGDTSGKLLRSRTATMPAAR